ncbi:MAG: hypothetical protein WAV45_02730 [Propionibacteriaceae bacterium]|nr:hypothetical protein [Micropruina sp.]HBX82574.1 hypothetical protein [Propionibacteriaceae bacterium]
MGSGRRAILGALTVVLMAGCAPPPDGSPTPATTALPTASARPTVLQSGIAPGAAVTVDDFFAAVENGRAKEVKVNVSLDVGLGATVSVAVKGSVDASNPNDVSTHVAGSAILTPTGTPTAKSTVTPGPIKSVTIDLVIRGDRVTGVIAGGEPSEISVDQARQRGWPVYEYRTGTVVAAMKPAVTSVVYMGAETQGSHFSLALSGLVAEVPWGAMTPATWRCDVWLDADGRVVTYHAKASTTGGQGYVKATEVIPA